jgi:tetratricopeptide (TPR) repeat protein
MERMPLARLVPLLLVLAIAAAYFELPRHEFINLDDPIYVLENPNLREPLGPASVARAFRAPYEHNWIPLTWLSLHLDYALYGPHPAGFLVTNALLHALAAALLFMAFARMTGAPGPSAFVAFVFALHPVHVESVAWVAERKDVLSGVCFAAALFVYSGGQGAGRRAGVALWLALGLLAKPMLVTLPFVLLLLDYWPLGRLAGRSGAALDPRALRAALWEKLPLFALALAASVVAFSVQQATGAVASLDRVPVSARLANAAVSIFQYLLASFWPTGLAAFYPLPAAPDWRLALPCALGLLALCALALTFARRAPYATVGWLWFLGMLVPVLGLVQVGLQARADRYLYLPQIGLSIALAWGARELSRTRPRRLLPAAAAAAIAALGVATAFQLRHWRDSERLWSRALAVTQRNFVAERALGDALVERGRPAEALPHYREAARLRPGWPEAELGLADAFAATGEVERALSIYRDRLRGDPQDARATGAMGLALLRVGRLDEARAALESARRLAPEKAVVLAGLGVVHQQQGRAREAALAYREALRRAPRLAEAANNLAWLLATEPDPALRNPAEAVRLAEGALEASPRPDPALLDTLAAAYAAAGRFEEALARAEEASMLAARDAPELARAIAQRVEGYRAGRAWVEAR